MSYSKRKRVSGNSSDEEFIPPHERRRKQTESLLTDDRGSPQCSTDNSSDEDYVPPTSRLVNRRRRAKVDLSTSSKVRHRADESPTSSPDSSDEEYMEPTTSRQQQHVERQRRFFHEHPDTHREHEYQRRQQPGYLTHKSNRRFQILMNQSRRNLPSDEYNLFLRDPNVYNEISRNSLGDRVECPYCAALHFQGSYVCCGKGKVYLSPFPKMPVPLDRLYNEHTTESMDFKKNILLYNAAFAFGSTQYHHVKVAAFGAQVIKAQGRVHHFSSCIRPRNLDKPRFGNLYVYTGDEAVKHRVGQALFTDLKEDLIRELTECMYNYNPHAHIYTTMWERMQLVEARGEDVQQMRLRIVDARDVDEEKLQQHPGTYAKPRSNSDFIAVFYTADQEQNVTLPGMRVYPFLGSGCPIPVYPWMSQINSFFYPLLFPRGEAGWGWKKIPYYKERYLTYLERLQKDKEDNPSKAEFWGFDVPAHTPSYHLHPGDPNLQAISDEEDEDSDSTEEEHQLVAAISSMIEEYGEGLTIERTIVTEERNGQLYPRRIEFNDEQIPVHLIGDIEDAEDDLLEDHNPIGEECALDPDQQIGRLFGDDEPFESQNDEEPLTGAILDGDQHREFVSFREHALYINQTRNPVYGRNRITSSGKLGQLFVVDQCTRMLAMRTQQIREHHTQYTTSSRTEFIQAMQKRMDRRCNQQGVPHRLIGYITSVPRTVKGSPRYLREKFENACALTNQLGHADLFTTFTTNVNWPEIKDNLGPGEIWSDNPLLVDEVFLEKLEAFLNRILGEPIKGSKTWRKPGIFGPVSWYTCSIEFQDRGPPHAHIVLSLAQHIRTSTEMDKVCQAYLPKIPDEDDPDYEKMKRLRELVEKFMVHRPCNKHPEMYCREHCPNYYKQCRKGFPKEFSDTTRMDDRDYPHLRRPDDGEQCEMYFSGERLVADNRWIVSTNFELLSEFECHINIEGISALRILKYIYKYLFKGFDRVLVEAITSMSGDTVTADMTISGHVFHPLSKNIPEGVIRLRNMDAEKRLEANGISPTDDNGNPIIVYDETHIIEDQRAMTPCEAAWELAGYPRSLESHSIVQLYVHCPKEEPVAIKPGEEEELFQKITREGIISPLTAWFILNNKLKEAGLADQLLTYSELPRYYVYRSGKWQRRGKNLSEFTRGHVHQVNPKNLELFAIRLLAMNLKGFTSFEDMRTVDGEELNSFVKAAKKHRLMNDQEEWSRALLEASSDKMPIQLRRLFSTILLFCAVVAPDTLWNSFKEYLFERRTDWDMARKEAHALFHIQSILRQHGTTLKAYHLPEINSDNLPSEEFLVDDAFADTTPANLASRICSKMVNKMYSEQKEAFTRITTSVMSNKKECYFVQGPGGSGKTYLYKALFYFFRGKDLKVLCVAHTGVAAMLLPNGATAHSTFKIPLLVEERMHCKIKLQLSEAEALRDVNVILWDEAPMTDRRIFQAVDELLKEIHKDDPDAGNRLFAGIPFVLGGDFRQTLPVVPGIHGESVLDYTIRRCDLWNQLTVLKLNQNIRAHGDKDYGNWVLSVGNGTANLNQQAREMDQEVQILPSLLVDTEAGLISRLYGNAEDPKRAILDAKIIESTCILTVDNRTTFELNDKVLKLIPGEEREYLSTDIYDDTRGFAALDPEFYNVATPSGLPPHRLKLKIGAIVMLLRNISVRQGLVNGTRIRITKMGDDILTGNIIRSGQTKRQATIDDEVVLHRMRLTATSESKCNELAFARWQFPVRLAFAVTCNKAQGQTLEHVGVVLRTPVFAHGQLYVALSRVRKAKDIVVYNAGTVKERTINVVHRSALT